MNVGENMSFALRLARASREEVAERVNRAAEMLELMPHLDRRPKDLSGGQRQRVAMGRAVVRDAYRFLFDEPLSNLDAKLRASMRTELSLLHKKLGRTMIYVTHDQIEAMTMADRIVIMKDGLIQQVGSPKEVYNDPANTFVATFIGSPSLPPMSSGYAVAGIFTFRIASNEFILALLRTGRNTRPLPVAAASYITEEGVEWGRIMAMGTLTVIPPLIFTFFAAKQIIAGMTAGTVKG